MPMQQRIPTDTKPSTGVNQMATSLLLARSAKNKGDSLEQQNQVQAAKNAFDKEVLSRREAWYKERQKLQKDLADTASQLSQSEDQSDLVELYRGYVKEGNVDAATAIAAVIEKANPQIVLESSERDLIKGSPDSEALKRGKFGAKLTPFERARQAGLTTDQQKRAAEIDAGISGSFEGETARQRAGTEQFQADTERDIQTQGAETDRQTADTSQYEAETERIKAQKEQEIPEKQQLSQYVLDNAEALGLTPEKAQEAATGIVAGEETTEQTIDMLFEKIDSLTLEPEDALKRKAEIVSAMGGVKVGDASSKTDFSATQDILNKYADHPENNTAFNRVANMISSKDQRQTFAHSIDRFAQGKSFKELSEPENARNKEDVARLMVQELMENATGGEIVKRHLRTQELLRVHLPEIMKTVDKLHAQGVDLGKVTAFTEKGTQFFGNTNNPEVAKINTRIKDLVAAFVALRSGAQVTEQERAMYTDIFAQMGRGYELNKAVIDGLLTNVLVELGSQYDRTFGKEWGDYATTLDFQPGEVSPVEYVSPEPGAQTETEVEVQGVDNTKNWDYKDGSSDDTSLEVMNGLTLGKAEGMTREQLDTALKDAYPSMTDAERKAFLDALESE